MKKSELKEIIKQCVKEALFEEGVLSEIIAEVAFGLTKAQSIVLEQSKKPSNPQIQEELDQEFAENQKRKLIESKKKMLNAIGNARMSNVFEGTEPLKSAGQTNTQTTQGPLSGRDPKDAGVDISGLLNLAGKKWNHLK